MPSRIPIKTLTLLAWAASAALAGCTVDVANTRAAQQLEAADGPAGSVYLGWRVFEERCARCHGSSASGKPGAPDLLARMRTLGPREFADWVLLRYEWPARSSSDRAGADRAAYVDDVVRRRSGEVTMPAWQGEPRVTAHVMDLHAYLSARADGTQPAGRPARR
jgi:mono/diheme cytochrome c family protein